MDDRQVDRRPRLVGGVKGHNIKEISFPGSPGLCAGNFTSGFLNIGRCHQLQFLERTSFHSCQGQSQSKKYKQSTRHALEHHGCAKVTPEVPTHSGSEAGNDQAPCGTGCDEGRSENQKWKNPMPCCGINNLGKEGKNEEDHVWIEEVRQHTLKIDREPT